MDLRGMGDIFINGAKNVRGSLSGIGHVHVPNDASCFLSMSGATGKHPVPGAWWRALAH